MVRSLEEPEPALVASFTSPLVARLFLWLRAVQPVLRRAFDIETNGSGSVFE